jgi:hypothetical protein
MQDAKNTPLKSEGLPKGKYPVVDFGHIQVTISVFTMTVDRPRPHGQPGDRETLAMRTQIPLRLGYALTIHKSQGWTLDKADLRLQACFERGQAYVALSRLRTLAGLHLVDFDSAKVVADPVVLDFYCRVFSRERIFPEANHQRAVCSTPSSSSSSSSNDFTITPEMQQRMSANKARAKEKRRLALLKKQEQGLTLAGGSLVGLSQSQESPLSQPSPLKPRNLILSSQPSPRATPSLLPDLPARLAKRSGKRSGKLVKLSSSSRPPKARKTITMTFR